MKFNICPTNLISAKGWTLEYLNRQNKGITGNIEKCGTPFDTSTCLWAMENISEHWYPYEQQAYWVDGVISSEEFISSNTAIMAHETCDIADYSWMLGYFFLATGNTQYLDIIERMCLNAAPAVVTPDFTAVQYFSSPNQVIAAENSTHCRYTKGTYTMSYRPYGWAACCIGNVNRIMPNYINKLWHKGDNNSIYATCYTLRSKLL